MTPAEKRLARRIHNQRVRLRWFEGLMGMWDLYWKRRALAYRKQLIDHGIKPDGVWSATYRLPTEGGTHG